MASFLGSPKMNVLKGTLTKSSVILADGRELSLPNYKKLEAGQTIIVGVWPQHIALAGKTVAKRHERVIELMQPKGSYVQVTLLLGSSGVVAELGAHEVSKSGKKTLIDFDMTHTIILDVATEQVIQEDA